jgi:predicted nuclease of predicted toxin-antitoxin system
VVRIFLDESADFPLANFLAKLGHDVTFISRDYPNSIADRVVLTFASEEKRILITNDRDFGKLIFRHNLPHAGVTLFRLSEESHETKSDWLHYVVDGHANDLRHFLVIIKRGIRMRRQRNVEFLNGEHYASTLK